MADLLKQVIAGLTLPQTGEAKVREVFPSVVATCPPAASLGRRLMLSKFLAPIGWFLLLPVYFWKILPFVSSRYTLTNRRVMFQRGLKPAPVQEVALTEISDVRLVTDDNSKFYRAATLEIVGKNGQVALTMPGVPDADGFRIAILNTVKAWGSTQKSASAPVAAAT